MTVDILLTILNAVLGLLLAGIGIEMVNNPPDSSSKKTLYRLLFVVFGCAALVTTTALSIRSANEQERARIEAQKKEEDLSDKVSRSAGKLDAIAQFEQQFLAFASQQRSNNTNSDAATKAYAAMSIAVLRMAQTSGVPAVPSDVHVQILYDHSELNGKTIFTLDAPNTPNNAKTIQLSEFHTKNYGGHATGPVSVRLYLSKPINLLAGQWEPTSSEEPDFPAAFWSGAGLTMPVINPQETWNWASFSGQVIANWDSNEEIKGKLKVFYGADKPAVANFSIRRKE